MRLSLAITAFAAAVFGTAPSHATTTQILLDTFGSAPSTGEVQAFALDGVDQEATATALGKSGRSTDYAYTAGANIGGSWSGYVVDRTLSTTITSLDGSHGWSAISVTPGGLKIADDKRTASFSTVDYTFGTSGAAPSMLGALAALPGVTDYIVSFTLDTAFKPGAFAAAAAWDGGVAKAFVASRAPGKGGTLYTVRLAGGAQPAGGLTLGFASGAGFTAYLNDLTLSAVQSANPFSVPEAPATGIFGLGLVALGWSRRRRAA